MSDKKWSAVDCIELVADLSKFRLGVKRGHMLHCILAGAVKALFDGYMLSRC